LSRYYLKVIPISFLFVACNGSLFPDSLYADGSTKTQPAVRIHSSHVGFHLAQDLIEAYEKNSDQKHFRLESIPELNSVRNFAAGECDILLRAATKDGNLANFEKTLLDNQFGSQKAVKLRPLGQLVLYVLVNKRNKTQSITIKQLEKIFRGRNLNPSQNPITDWNQVSNGEESGPINYYIPPRAWYDSYVMRLKGMNGRKFGPRAGDFSKKPYAQQTSISGVVGSVIKDPKGIGFIAVPPGFSLDNRAKIISIQFDETAGSVAPTISNIYADNYELANNLVIYLHPEASLPAQQFYQYVTSAAATKIISKHRFFPEYDRQKYFSDQRIAAAKKGEGTEIVAYGHKSGIGVLRALTNDLTKAYKPLRLKYTVKPQLQAVTEFTRPDVDLLLTDQPLLPETRKQYYYWFYKRKPEKFEIGQVGVGIVVHPLNPIDGLKLKELQDIFTGRTSHWSDFERYASTNKNSNNNDSFETAINRYGLRPRSKEEAARPVIELFREVILGSKRMRRLQAKPTSEEIIKALSLDPTGIGFINLADLDPTATNVKLIGIVPVGKSFPATVKPYE